jgi:hypothetical protein
MQYSSVANFRVFTSILRHKTQARQAHIQKSKSVCACTGVCVCAHMRAQPWRDD